MESAFGIDHGEVSKGLNPRAVTGLENTWRSEVSAGRQGGIKAKYASNKLLSHQAGQAAAKKVFPSARTGLIGQGQQHAQANVGPKFVIGRGGNKSRRFLP